MPFHLLYIEDDIIDVLALKRLLRNYEDVALTVCPSVASISDQNLDGFDFILSDSHLPDGNLSGLREILPLDKTKFISGTEIAGENVWTKPIGPDQLESILNKTKTVNLKYINDLADGDDAYVQEMIDTALAILPARWQEIEAAQSDIILLKKAAHKTKSSYRVCGIPSQWLVELEELDEVSFDSDQKHLLLDRVKKQIDQAIAELNTLKY